MTYPHIESTADYRQYESDFADGAKGLKFLSGGACRRCDDCGLTDDSSDHDYDLASEPFFSWRRCDLCFRDLGGDRYPAHYVDDNDDINHIDVCCDCYYYIAYGRLDDMTMMEIENA